MYTSAPPNAMSILQTNFTSIQQALTDIKLLLDPSRTKFTLYSRNKSTALKNITNKQYSILFIHTSPISCWTRPEGWASRSTDIVVFGWTTHINKLQSQSQIKSRLVSLYGNKTCFTVSSKITQVKTCTLPTIDYGGVIYRNTTKKALAKLDTPYQSAIRFATGAPNRTHFTVKFA